MKWILCILFLFCIAVGVFVLKTRHRSPAKMISSAALSPSITKTPHVASQSSLFVPYWSLTQEKIESKNFDSLLYFGLAVNEKGIDTEDDGYKNIDRFMRQADEKTEKQLVVRMVDSKTNFEILENQQTQNIIIKDSIALAKQKGFSAVILNLEVASLPFNSVTTQINNFVKDFADETHKNSLRFGITLNGDTFSKIRPYDVKFLSNYADTVFLMAYDFSKAKGDPGPNFPLNGKEVYGYDFKTMITDFINLIPKEKITVVFGMFGYDWALDTDNKPLKQAESISLFAAEQKFLPTCRFKSCTVKRDSASGENHVTYTDSQGQSHSVWFEDYDSVDLKKAFLKEKGINFISFWAYSYF